jgi:hypothetical protein
VVVETNKASFRVPSQLFHIDHLPLTMARPNQMIKAESWTAFHSRHHSDSFRFSCLNERIRNTMQRTPPRPIHESDGLTWIDRMLGNFEPRHYSGSEINHGHEDSWSSLRSCRSSVENLPPTCRTTPRRGFLGLLRKEKWKGNIKIASLGGLSKS